MPGESVEFVTNTFERNIEQVTAPGFLDHAASQHNHPFSSRTLLINNVLDRESALLRARAAVERGEIDRFVFVDEHVDQALKALGLKKRDLGRYLHWSDCCVVALTLEGPDLLCYADVDLELRGTGDWIAAALLMFDSDSRIGVANPNWRMADGYSSSYIEADEAAAEWRKGYGFSDQVFLCRRSRLSRPLMQPRWLPVMLKSPASARYPGQQVLFGPSTLFFEQILDAFLRRERILRLTLTDREFEPIPMSTYEPEGLEEQLAAKGSRLFRRALRALRRHIPAAMSNPRLRETGLLDPDYR